MHALEVVEAGGRIGSGELLLRGRRNDLNMVLCVVGSRVTCHRSQTRYAKQATLLI